MDSCQDPKPETLRHKESVVSLGCLGEPSAESPDASAMSVFVQMEVQGQTQDDCLLDTGAAVSLMPRSRIVNVFLKEVPSTLRLQTATGAAIPLLGKATLSVTLPTANGKPQWHGEHTFYVASIITGPVIGADFLGDAQMDVSFSRGVLETPTGRVPLMCRKPAQPRYEVVLDQDVELTSGVVVLVVPGRLRRSGGKAISSFCALFSPRTELSSQGLWSLVGAHSGGCFQWRYSCTHVGNRSWAV